MAENTFVVVLTRWAVDIDPLDDDNIIITQISEMSNGFTKKLFYKATTQHADTDISGTFVATGLAQADTWANT